MAALSMKCGICHMQLRSVQEAQEHAELTGHTDFAESTEPVLNLVCRTCGKPCRTKTECDLHTKRTGHEDFDDKTSEAAKPISLETKADKEAPTDSVLQTTAENELVVPEVNQQMLEELESMGFPQARAKRALHFSGSASVEAAINWVVEHENDPDIDEVPMVPASEKATRHYTPEEAKAKMLELRERARKKKEEEERRMEREREKERIRIGKELLEAKRIEEENERKRLILMRKAEKEEEQRAREKIRLKLEEDKADRRRKMGLLPVEDIPKSQPAPPAVEEKKSHLPVRPATKAEQMRECLRSLKQNHKDEDARVKKAFQTLLTYVGNIVRSPDEEKFRKIRISNPSFQERVGSLKGGIQFLELCGFEGGSDEFLTLPREKVDIAILNTAGAELNSAIVNPFFGVL